MQYARRVNGDRTLNEATRRLIDVYQPDRIYLYGSLARGEAREESDIDVLVVVPDDASTERRRGAIGYQALRGVGAPIEIGVVRRSWFDRRTHLRASLPGVVVREGRLLYGA